jgi:hypothetical protein
MVCRRMGLLDDAIREHLELKRRRGADPGEVAREQQEALDSVIPGDPAPSNGGAESPPKPVLEDSGERTESHHEAAEDPDYADAHLPDAHLPDAHDHGGQESEDPPGLGEETAELDMESVLREDHGATHPHEQRHDTGDSAARSEESHPYGDVPGQERLSFE